MQVIAVLAVGHGPPCRGELGTQGIGGSEIASNLGRPASLGEGADGLGYNLGRFGGEGDDAEREEESGQSSHILACLSGVCNGLSEDLEDFAKGAGHIEVVLEAFPGRREPAPGNLRFMDARWSELGTRETGGRQQGVGPSLKFA